MPPSPCFLIFFPPHPPPPSVLRQLMEKLLDLENETIMKVADLEKRLLHKDKELTAIKVGANR